MILATLNNLRVLEQTRVLHQLRVLHQSRVNPSTSSTSYTFVIVPRALDPVLTSWMPLLTVRDPVRYWSSLGIQGSCLVSARPQTGGLKDKPARTKTDNDEH